MKCHGTASHPATPFPSVAWCHHHFWSKGTHQFISLNILWHFFFFGILEAIGYSSRPEYKTAQLAHQLLKKMHQKITAKIPSMLWLQHFLELIKTSPEQFIK
jgi:hypothetical protein